MGGGNVGGEADAERKSRRVEKGGCYMDSGRESIFLALCSVGGERQGQKGPWRVNR